MATTQAVRQSEPGSNRTDSDEDVVFVENEKPVDEKKTSTPPAPITKGKAPKQVTPIQTVAIDDYDDIESTTPPIPAGMLSLKMAAMVVKPEISVQADDCVADQEANNQDVINHDKVNKIKESGAKRSDWDMFAEQDNYSNFDVSIWMVVQTSRER